MRIHKAFSKYIGIFCFMGRIKQYLCYAKIITEVQIKHQNILVIYPSMVVWYVEFLYILKADTIDHEFLMESPMIPQYSLKN